MSKKITNPTNEEISIQYKGVVYTIPALGSIKILDEAAVYWKTMIHSFVQVEEESEVEPAKEVPKEVEEVKEEVREVEVVQPKVAAKVKSKK